MRLLVRAALKALSFIICLVALSAQAGGIVTAATEANLRAALAGGGTVTFAVDGTITLTGTLVITNDTVLDGTGHAVTLSGEGAVGILHVWPGTKLTLNRLTVANGYQGFGFPGGAGLRNQGETILADCTFSNNVIASGIPIFGGAILHQGSRLQVTGSTFVRNGSTAGGAISCGHPIGGSSNGNIGVTNCTFYANWGQAVAIGEPLLNPVTLANCTFAWNTNGAINHSVILNPSAAPVRLINSIVANSVGAANCSGVVDLGRNLSTDASLTNATSLLNADPLLGSLADNGGPTWTMALGVGSPALNQADVSVAPATDQRGAARPVGSAADIGAYEGTAAPADGVRFAAANYSVGEGAGQAAIQIERTGSTAGAVTVSFAASPGTATAQDFLPTNFVVSFGDSESAKTVSVSITNDAQIEANETVLLTLSNPGGAVLDSPSSATLTILDDDQPLYLSSCDEAGLRTAISNGTWIVFSCDGTITLTSPININGQTTLDAGGHNVVLSGGNATRLFSVTSGGRLTLKDLTLSQGKSTGNAGGTGSDGGSAFGGAVLVNQGTLTALNCRFWTNSAVGGAAGSYPSSGGASLGGAVYLTDGVFNATNSYFVGNLAQGGIGAGDSYTVGGKAWGGAVCGSNSTFNLDSCTFVMNQAVGGLAPNNPGPGGPGDSGTSGAAVGGAMATLGGTSYVAHCSFASNQCLSPQPVGPLAGSGGATAGGAIYHAAGSMSVADTVFSSNQAIGGTARRHLGSSGTEEGGSIFNLAALEVTGCTFRSNSTSGGNQGIVGADANGGAIFNGGTVVVQQTLFDSNSAAAGAGYHGGQAYTPNGVGNGGALFNTNQLVLVDCTLSGNSAHGVPGGLGSFSPYPGSSAFGGAIYNAGTCNLTNNTIVANTASGGSMVVPAPPPVNCSCSAGGDAYGGGVFNTNGSLAIANVTLSGNSANRGTGFPDGNGHGGGFANANGTVTLLNAIVANSLFGSNGFGPLTDLGHNLSSDASCGFAGAGSLNNTEPILGPLANYGGPTPTMPLLTGSPAIDAGAVSGAPPTDQRGRARAFGAAVDIGAFESSPPYVIRGSVTGVTLIDEVNLSGAGATGTSNGWFSLEGVNPGAYTVTPAHANYLFVPGDQTLTVGPDQLGVNFHAYRWNTLSLDDATNGVLHLVFAGTNGITYRTLWSSNLASWTPVSTNTVNASSYFELLFPLTPPEGYFRVVTP